MSAADRFPALGARTGVAVRLGRLAAALSRRTGLGSGGMIGGRVTLALAPDALRRLSGGRTITLVTGTNGKTTTTLMIRRAVEATKGPVASNGFGANMPDGAVAALALTPEAPYGVLEIDEPHLPQVIDATAPAVVVLLNLSRDQLDRIGEVRQLTARIGAELVRHRDATVVANADDVMVVASAIDAASTVWVSAGTSWTLDAGTCPRCGGLISREGRRWWSACGLARPHPEWTVDGDKLYRAGGEAFPLQLALPGRANRSNAAMAVAAATALGSEPEAALAAVRQVREVAGRYRVVQRNGCRVRLLLAKNPAGWAEMLPIVADAQAAVIAINAREADGRDPSWLWDVPFERLRGRQVVATGERAADLAVRLTYGEVDHRVVADPVAAIDAIDTSGIDSIDLVANYTAFHQILRRLPRES